VPDSVLMENAGRHVADFIYKNISSNYSNIIAFCGTGNNGGDGFVACKYLYERYNVSMFLTGDEKDIKTDISMDNFRKLKEKNIKIYNKKSIDKLSDLFSEDQIIIDSMLGIGLTGSLREPYSSIVKVINSLKNRMILSVDIPTGLGTNLAIKPNHTITFHDVKEKMNKKNSGNIVKVDIGIPQKAIDYVGPGELSVFYPKSDRGSHKGDNGKLLIIGGGPFIGAPALAGLAALRTGSDLAYIAAPRRAARAITSFSPLFIKPKRQAKTLAMLSPNLIVIELTKNSYLVSEDLKLIRNFIPKIDAVVIGPGIGGEQITLDTVERIIIECVKHKKSIVVDADAIQVIGKKPELIINSQTVVTPHAGEFKKLTGVKLSDDLDDRKEMVEKWAKKLGVTIFLKGPIDVISNGVQTKLNDVHNEAMTVGGTGDVLSGVIGALLSKNVEPYNAARTAAFINGAAGNVVFEKKSYGLIATDIIEEIPSILKRYL
jgi:NAD(P)H-hydrate epimerase